MSQRIGIRVDEILVCMKTVGGFRKLRYKGTRNTEWTFLLGAGAFNLVRMAQISRQAT